MKEREFKVRFNFQNWLKEEIVENNYSRISSILDIDIKTVKKLILGFQKSVEQQATALDKDNKYSSLIDKAKIGKVVFIGDSITSDRESFAKIICKVFSLKHSLEFVDVGVSGWRTTEFLDDFYFKVLNHNAQFAHVMLGTNGVRRSRFDYGKCNVSPQEFEKNIKYLLMALNEHGTKAIVTTCRLTICAEKRMMLAIGQ